SCAAYDAPWRNCGNSNAQKVRAQTEACKLWKRTQRAGLWKRSQHAKLWKRTQPPRLFVRQRRLPQIQHEIEPGGEAVPRLGHAHQQLTPKQAVAAVHRLVGEVELGREHRPFWRLHLDVIVPGAAGIDRRQDGAKAVTPLPVAEQVAAVAEAGVVVLALLV